MEFVYRHSDLPRMEEWKVELFETSFTNAMDAGLKKPAGTGPVTAVTGLTGPDRFRFRPVPNRPKFKF